VSEMGIFDKLFGKKKEELPKKAEETSKTHKTLIVRKFVSAEAAKEHLEEYGLKSGLFLMHERDLLQYPWIKKAIVDLECAVALELSEQEIKQFREMSAGTSTIILSVTRNGIHAKVIYLLRLI
jgi:hypothetical protein